MDIPKKTGRYFRGADRAAWFVEDEEWQSQKTK